MHFMRLSLRKGAQAALSSATWQEIRVGITKKVSRVLRYPTQAKTGLEWGTQRVLTMKHPKKSQPLGMTNWRAVAHLGMGGGGWTDSTNQDLQTYPNYLRTLRSITNQKANLDKSP
jgi:hypothetical protein